MGYVEKTNIEDIAASLKYIGNLLARPIYLETSTARLKVTVDAGTIGTVSSVTTVQTISNLGSQVFPVKDTMLNSLDRNLWYNSVRGRIS